MRVAMIGAGNYARAHLAALEQEPDIEIVGHVSPTTTHREASARRWGGRAYASCADLLANEQLDAAWITVPPHAHGDIESQLIGANVPFFVEKPLSADRETAERIADAIEERDLVVGVGYKLRALDGLSEVRQLLVEKPAQLIVGAWHGGTPAAKWWRQQEMSGGQMVEQATHLFDLARYLVGEASVISATATYAARPTYQDMTVASASSALLEFGEGATGVFTATCLLQGASEIHLKLICDGLLITVQLDGMTFEDAFGRREVKANKDLLVTENRSFLEAVKSGDKTRLLSSYEDALLTHRLCFDVLEASS